jgi:hypothetical protein
MGVIKGMGEAGEVFRVVSGYNIIELPELPEGVL